MLVLIENWGNCKEMNRVNMYCISKWPAIVIKRKICSRPKMDKHRKNITEITEYWVSITDFYLFIDLMFMASTCEPVIFSSSSFAINNNTIHIESDSAMRNFTAICSYIGKDINKRGDLEFRSNKLTQFMGKNYEPKPDSINLVKATAFYISHLRIETINAANRISIEYIKVIFNPSGRMVVQSAL